MHWLLNQASFQGPYQADAEGAEACVLRLLLSHIKGGGAGRGHYFLDKYIKEKVLK